MLLFIYFVADLKKAKEGTDLDAIKKASEALTTEMQKIGEAMAKAQPTEEPKKEGGEEKKDDNIKDADFTEEKK